jgi:cell division protein FtsQ
MHTKKGSPSESKLGFKIVKMIVGLALLSTLSCLFILGHDYLVQCDYFKAKRLQLEGNHRLGDTVVFEQAGVDRQINILAINLQKVRRRLLAHPWIADAQVRREIPDGLSIKIVEHQPLAIVDLGRRFLINTQGRIFKEWRAGDPTQLPIVSGMSFADITVFGQGASRPYSAVRDVLQLGRKHDAILPNHLIKQIHVDREIGLTLTLVENSRTIKLGYDDYERKYVHLRNVLYYLEDKLEWRDYVSIDLNNPERVVLHPNRKAA